MRAVFCPRFVLIAGQRHYFKHQGQGKKKWQFAESLLLVHLSNHEGQPDYDEESKIDHLSKHMLWEVQFGEKVIGLAHKNGYLLISGQNLVLTDRGREYVEEIKESTI